MVVRVYLKNNAEVFRNMRSVSECLSLSLVCVIIFWHPGLPWWKDSIFHFSHEDCINIYGCYLKGYCNGMLVQTYKYPHEVVFNFKII